MAPGATELSVSRDGSVVGFVTDQALVTDDHNETGDVYVVLRSGDGGLRAITVPGDGSSSAVEVSADGSTVAFVSAATNLVDGDTNGRDDIFVADVETGEIRRVNVDELGQQADVGLLPGGRPSLSADGLLIAFADSARLIGGAPLGDDPLVYERDLETGITRSVAHGDEVSLSGDGKVLAYAGDGQVHAEIDGDAVELISATPGGEPGNARSRQPDVNDDGSLIAFASDATDLVGGDPGPEHLPATAGRRGGDRACLARRPRRPGGRRTLLPGALGSTGASWRSRPTGIRTPVDPGSARSRCVIARTSRRSAPRAASAGSSRTAPPAAPPRCPATARWSGTPRARPI